MTTVGWDPARLHTFRTALDRTLDDLAAIDSSDPAAATAIDVVRRVDRFLRAEVRPTVLTLIASDVLTGWSRRVYDTIRAAIVVEIAAPAVTAAERWRALSNDELLDALDTLGADLLAALFAEVDDDLLDQLDLGELDALAAELAHRAAADPQWWSQVAATGYRWPVLAVAVGRAPFPDTFVVELARALLCNPAGGPVDGRDILAAHLLQTIASHRPELAAPIVSDDEVLDHIIDDQRAAVVDDAVQQLLATAFFIGADDDHIDESFGLLARFVARAGAELPDPVLLAVADGSVFHLPRLSPGRAVEGRTSIVPVGGSVDVGGYADLAALYGQVMRLEEGQLAAGYVLDQMLRYEFEHRLPVVLAKNSEASRPQDTAGLIGSHAVQVVSLVDLMFVDGIATERSRQLFEAGAAASTGNRVAGVIDRAVSTAAAFFPIGRGVQLTVRLVTAGLLQHPAPAAGVTDGGYRFTVVDHVTAAVVREVVHNPTTRRDVGLDQLDPATLRQLTTIAERLDALEGRGGDDLVEARRSILDQLDLLPWDDRALVNSVINASLVASGVKNLNEAER